MKLVPLKKVLNRYLGELGLNEKNEKIYYGWEKTVKNIAGNLAKHNVLLGIKKGYLEVEIDSASAFQEFILRKKELIENLNREISFEPKIKGIHFHLKK